MRQSKLMILGLASLLIIAGCGSDDDDNSSTSNAPQEEQEDNGPDTPGPSGRLRVLKKAKCSDDQGVTQTWAITREKRTREKSRLFFNDCRSGVCFHQNELTASTTTVDGQKLFCYNGGNFNICTNGDVIIEDFGDEEGNPTGSRSYVEFEGNMSLQCDQNYPR